MVSNVKNTIHFWRGVVDPSNLTKIASGQKVDDKLLKKVEKVREVLTQLVNNDYSHGLSFEKLRNYDIYSVRLNDSDRILFTNTKVKGKNCLLLLDIIFDHKYAGSKFLKPDGVKRFYTRNSEILENETLDVENLPWEETEKTLEFDNKKDASEVDYSAVDYYKSKFILFDNIQEKALKAKLPVIVNGPPGSGKTCIALSALINYMSVEENQEDKKILYVCASENLAASMQKKWKDHPLSELADPSRSVIEFKSYDAVIHSINGKKSSSTKVTENDKIQWLLKQWGEINKKRNENIKSKKNKGKRPQASMTIGEQRSIFDEFLVMSTCKDIEEYQKIGKKKSHFQTPEKQQVVWDLFKAYCQWLKNEEKHDPKFYELSQKALYDLTVVDESADFSPVAMMQLFFLTKDGQIAYFLDTQQDLEDSLSKRNMLKERMHTHNIKINSIDLPSVYRCPQAVVDFANKCLGLKAFLMGGISDKEEYRSIEAASKDNKNGGECIWSEKDVRSVYQEMLDKGDKDSDIAFITSPANKKALSGFIDHPLIFTAEEIKGLEYPVIILYEPFSIEEYKEIDARLVDVKQDALEGNRHRSKDHQEQNNKSKVAPLMSKLFTSVTRAEEKLIICQKNVHGIENIHRLLWNKKQNEAIHVEKTKESSSKPAETSTQDWWRRAKELYLEGKLEQFNKICRNRLKKEPKEVIREIELEENKKLVFLTSSIPNNDSDAIRNESEGSFSGSKNIKRGNKKQAQRKSAASSSANKVITKNTQAKDFLKAASEDNIRVVKTLIRAQVNVNAQDINGKSALHLAVEKGSTEIVQLLIDNNIDLNLKDKDQKTALMLASGKNAIFTMILNELKIQAKIDLIYEKFKKNDRINRNRVIVDYKNNIKYITTAAHRGYAQAQVCLGNMYQEGIIVEQNYKKAFEYYGKAADQGDAVGQYNLGFMYEYGMGVVQSHVKAAEYYGKAAAQEYAQAQVSLGFMHQEGLGIAQNYLEAAQYYRKAADQGDAQAQVSLGFMHQKGLGITQNYVEAAEYYRKAADQGHAQAQFGLGVVYQEGLGIARNYVEAAKYYHKAAGQGDVQALVGLGVMCEKGLGIAQNYVEAAKYYRKAAGQGSVEAQFNLGRMYQLGMGIAQDYGKAREYYSKAADQGNAQAQIMLGAMYRLGMGVGQEGVKATECFRKAADQENAQAQVNLGAVYQDRLAVDQEGVKATECFRKAADQENAQAQVNLGAVYQDRLGVGLEGVKATEWACTIL